MIGRSALKLFLLVCLSAPVFVMAQQTPHYTMHILNNYMINPAVTGATHCWEANAGYRNQWVGFPGGGPVTMFANAHGRLNSKKRNKKTFEGIGAYFIKDATGPMSTIGGHVSYAFHIPMNRKFTTSLGISAGVQQFVVDAGTLSPFNPTDPAVSSSSSILPDANFGIWMYSEDLFMGAAARQLFPLTISGTGVRLLDHLYFTIGYRMLVKKTISIIPSAHVRMGLITPPQLDATIRVDWGNKFWVGVAYRKIEGIAGLLGFNIGPMIKLGYSYDYTLSKIGGVSSGSHEIVLGYRPRCNRGKNRKICPAYM
ncbi:MAG: type IX secretion system membrane protein PorP/SprF [Flavobacteriales bacterium]|nr:type IX secretion system membrane protein PorP/SprF [Flavobacteriales bacterium]